MPPPPPSITREVYCFPRHQLFFSFGRYIIYHSKGFLEYILKLIPFVCPSVRYHDLQTNSWTSFYTSMDLSRRSLQTNGELFSNLKFVFRIIGRKPNLKGIFERIASPEY